MLFEDFSGLYTGLKSEPSPIIMMLHQLETHQLNNQFVFTANPSSSYSSLYI